MNIFYLIKVNISIYISLKYSSKKRKSVYFKTALRVLIKLYFFIVFSLSLLEKK